MVKYPNEGNLAPIALFVYRRPSRVRRVIQSLLQNDLAQASDIYIFSDAAKTADAADDVAAIRHLVHSTRGFRTLNIIERAENFGLARSIVDGVTSLCDSYGKVIVVEDDLVVAPHFLEFLNEGLSRYRDDDRVMQIAGHAFPFGVVPVEDAFFLPLTTSWGWATWDRAWSQFDPEARGYDVLCNDRAMRRRFDFDGTYPYFAMLEHQMHGKVDSWAIRWHLSVFMRDGLVLYPRRSLVAHEGWDETATHAKRKPQSYVPEVDNDFRAMTFPVVELDPQHYSVATDYFRSASYLSKETLFTRLRDKMSVILRKHRSRNA